MVSRPRYRALQRTSSFRKRKHPYSRRRNNKRRSHGVSVGIRRRTYSNRTGFAGAKKRRSLRRSGDSALSKSILAKCMWHGHSIQESNGVFTSGANNTVLWTVPEAANFFDDFKAAGWDAAAQLMTNSLINSAVQPYPMFTLFETRTDLKIRSHNSPGGTDVEVFMLTPRRAERVGTTLGSEIATGVTQSASAPTLYNLTATSYQDPSITLYDFPTVTSKYRIKRLWKGRLLIGEHKDIKVVKRFAGGIPVKKISYQYADSTTSHTQGYLSLPEHKPYFLVTRCLGCMGGNLLANPTTEAFPPASMGIYARTSYHWGMMPNVNMLSNNIVGAGVAGFSAAPFVGSAGAISIAG